ncbi:MAG: nucleotidyl transferase AbiEii/AbiGii toxin family protein [bacterium]
MSSYYEEEFYPLQDNVLDVLETSDLPFYLTGGTALHRGYYEIRYSDDLYLFVNDASDFPRLQDRIIFSLNQLDYTIERRSEDFLQLTVREILQVDFVNDVPAYVGKTADTSLYFKLDNPRNILANKLCSLSGRDEPKDVVDIWAIDRENEIHWEKIFTQAQSKTAGVYPPAVARKIDEMPEEMFGRIKFTDSSYRDQYLEQKDRLVDSILSVDDA